MVRWLTLFVALLSAPAWADETLESRFSTQVAPFLKTYCHGCHGSEKAEAKLDLSVYVTSTAVAKHHDTWAAVLERLDAGEMPPESARKRPSDAERKAVTEWIRAFRQEEAERTAGDPGPVLARRLSNAEYDYTIRDLTGADIRPTKEFPVDPANEAGFDNSGESLAMSPALLKKYLAAARLVADHVVLKPEGFVFAPHPAVTDPDRDKYGVFRIVDFYNRHEVDLAKYIEAAWRFRHRETLGRPDVTLHEFASEARLSSKYLAQVWATLSESKHTAGPMAAVLRMWNELPVPTAESPDAARAGCERLREFVNRVRKDLADRVDKLPNDGFNTGSQHLILWRNHRQAEHRMTWSGKNLFKNSRSFDFKLERPEGDLVLHFMAERVSGRTDKDFVVWKSPTFHREVLREECRRGNRNREDQPKPESRTLRQLLEKQAPDELKKVAFGRDSEGGELDADSFALKVGSTLTLTLPATALYEKSDDAWKLVTEAQAPGSHFQGVARVDCTDFIPQATLADAVAREAYLVRENDPEAKPLEPSFAEFCQVFPDRFFVSSRPPHFEDGDGPSGRLLTAGFHLMLGYFRDDTPLCELVLSDIERAELDRLWQELYFVSRVPDRQLKDFIYYERAESPRVLNDEEFDFARAEDKDATSELKLKRLADVYLARARRIGTSDVVVGAIEDFFRQISADIRWVEKARRDAEPSHLEHLVRFAERAYRRPITPQERDELLGFYRELRERDKLDHEDAIRDAIASVLMSPHFCYRFDLAQPGDSARPLSDYELASRLSYFLWSSLPDDELLSRAKAGDLREPAVLITQTRRMLREPKARALAVEFGGNWLDIRRFEEHNAVDRERFPQFNDELRTAMFEEPMRFLLDLIQNDRPVLDCLYASHTFVNAPLAKHYGIRDFQPGPDGWARVETAHEYGRGGLLPMAVFLTKNAPGLRTSPVKRGYWVVRRLLGETIPPPPPEVPELPKDEAQLGALTLPQILARHREHRSCAACHERFDSLGLAFEGYGPIGEKRDLDLGGKPVQTTATYPDKSEGTGLDGLRAYLKARRESDFLDNLTRKLLAYALGRGLMLSDQKTLDAMRTALAKENGRLGTLVETIVASPQFLTKRGMP